MSSALLFGVHPFLESVLQTGQVKVVIGHGSHAKCRIPHCHVQKGIQIKVDVFLDFAFDHTRYLSMWSQWSHESLASF
jgi:hypothetical protein